MKRINLSLILVFLCFISGSSSCNSSELSTKVTENETFPKEILLLGKWVPFAHSLEAFTYSVEPLEYSNDEESVKLTIRNDKYDKIFNEEFKRVENILVKRLLLDGSTQLVIEYNNGGNDNFLKILSFKEKKITSIIKGDSLENEVQIDGLFYFIPKLNKNKADLSFPLQLYIFSPNGRINVYSYKNGKYHKNKKTDIGKFQSTIETLSPKNNLNEAPN